MLVKKSLIIQEVVTLLNVETPEERLAACKAAIEKFNSVSHKVQLGINRHVEYKRSGIGVYKVYGFVDFCSTGPCEARWVDNNTFAIYYVDYSCE